MGSVLRPFKSKYEIQLTGWVVVPLPSWVVGLSEGLEDAAPHDGGPHVLVGLLVGDEVNGSLAGRVPQRGRPRRPRTA